MILGRCIGSIFCILLISLSFTNAHATRNGQNHALLIGNQNYESWQDLSTPHADIDRLNRVLVTRYGFETVVMKDVGRDEIIDQLEHYKRTLTEKDSLLIYFAGHGQIRENGGYWIGVNAATDSRSRWLHYDTINDLIDKRAGMNARHVLIIADSCFSGSALRSQTNSAQRYPNEARDAWLARVESQVSRRVITSGGEEPVLDRIGNSQNSVFSIEFIAALETNTAILDVGSLFHSIKDDVYARAKRVLRSSAQAPELGHIPGTGHGGGEFLFVPTGAAYSVSQQATSDDSTGWFRGNTSRWPNETPVWPITDRPISDAELLEVVNSFQKATVYFESNSAELSNEQTKVLDALVTVAQGHFYKEIWVLDHSDAVGSHSAANVLSSARAGAVGRYLQSKGIPSARIKLQSWGKKRIVANGGDDWDHALNRRVEVIMR